MCEWTLTLSPPSQVIASHRIASPHQSFASSPTLLLAWIADTPPADLLNQAKGAATSALNTASNLASQATAAASDLATQAANSQVAATVTEQAKVLGTHATQLAGQAHAQAHAAAPSIVPPPSGGSIDRAHDLSPTSEVDKEKLDKLFAQRANAAELQGKGILKGELWQVLAAASIADSVRRTWRLARGQACRARKAHARGESGVEYIVTIPRW
jgi:ubiquitin carboxyl-terminal hydrolase 16/45